MSDYLRHLDGLYSSKTFARKLAYIEYNFGAYLVAGQTALEVGPGMGEFLAVLARHGITDVDVIERDAAVGRRVLDQFAVTRHWEVAAEQIASIRSELRRYDIIVLSQVLEHVRKEALGPLVNALYAQLKPGGRILITVPNGGNPFSAVERYADLTHETVFGEPALRQLVEMAGLANADLVIRGYRIPPVSLVNLLRIGLQKILHLCLLGVMMVNGGNYFRILTPNICLIVSRKAG
jgi:2-polyprenyl-3-methyl-5-hydroxy-6-metoxy-1,4-benzoquinol methylase